MHSYGRHADERQMEERTSLRHGSMELRSTRGTSSHQHNPIVILADEHTTESTGECYNASFVYSGNFQAQAEVKISLIRQDWSWTSG